VGTRPLQWMLSVAACALPMALFAQGPSNMISPTNPILVGPQGTLQSSNQNQSIGLTRVNNVITITSPWTCNGASNKNKVTLSNPSQATGRFQTATRFSENLNKSQAFTILQYDAQGNPIQFRYDEFAGVTETRTGIGTLLSSQNNFVYDTLEIQSTTGINTTVNFLAFPLGGNQFLSIPWSQLASLGGKTTDCTGQNPQAYVPVTPAGHIVFDLDGNGSPDVDLYQSPALAAATVGNIPTLGPMGLVALATLLLGFAIYWLRRESGLTPTAEA